MVLGSHVHPSVAAMARTLLSGANIVYNGNPLNDLSLTSFLDKFMEKKPKQSTWHGASQIEPAKKVRHLHVLSEIIIFFFSIILGVEPRKVSFWLLPLHPPISPLPPLVLECKECYD